MTTKDVADDFVALCRQGKFDEAGAKHWADTVVSLEPMGGPEARAEGVAAVRAKGEWWVGAHEVHSATCSDARVNGDMFMVEFDMDITERASGNRMQMHETALYTLADGKIVEERFFYPT